MDSKIIKNNSMIALCQIAIPLRSIATAYATRYAT